MTTNKSKGKGGQSQNEVWEHYGNNTNAAEAAYAQANREGKQLKLLTAIMRFYFV